MLCAGSRSRKMPSSSSSSTRARARGARRSRGGLGEAARRALQQPRAPQALGRRARALTFESPNRERTIETLVGVAGLGGDSSLELRTDASPRHGPHRAQEGEVTVTPILQAAWIEADVAEGGQVAVPAEQAHGSEQCRVRSSAVGDLQAPGGKRGGARVRQIEGGARSGSELDAEAPPEGVGEIGGGEEARYRARQQVTSGVPNQEQAPQIFLTQAGVVLVGDVGPLARRDVP